VVGKNVNLQKLPQKKILFLRHKYQNIKSSIHKLILGKENKPIYVITKDFFHPKNKLNLIKIYCR